MTQATALDAPLDALDEEEQRFVQNIQAHGWFHTNVFEGETTPEFSYTTGFWLGCTAPEVVIFGLRSEAAHAVLWNVYRAILDGWRAKVGAPFDDFTNFPMCAFPVAAKNFRTHLGWSRWFYGGDDFECLQFVWPDKAGKFPWQPSFDTAFQSSQPDVTELGWRACLPQ